MQQGQNIKLACWIAEVLRKHRGMTRKQARDGAIEMLGLVGIGDMVYYP